MTSMCDLIVMYRSFPFCQLELQGLLGVHRGQGGVLLGRLVLQGGEGGLGQST